MESNADLEATRPRILTHRVMENFFDRVLREDRPISSLTLVSPWISNWEKACSSTVEQSPYKRLVAGSNTAGPTI